MVYVFMTPPSGGSSVSIAFSSSLRMVSMSSGDAFTTISELLVFSATTRTRPAVGSVGAVAPAPENWASIANGLNPPPAPPLLPAAPRAGSAAAGR